MIITKVIELCKCCNLFDEIIYNPMKLCDDCSTDFLERIERETYLESKYQNKKSLRTRILRTRISNIEKLIEN